MRVERSFLEQWQLNIQRFIIQALRGLATPPAMKWSSYEVYRIIHVHLDTVTGQPVDKESKRLYAALNNCSAQWQFTLDGERLVRHSTGNEDYSGYHDGLPRVDSVDFIAIPVLGSTPLNTKYS